MNPLFSSNRPGTVVTRCGAQRSTRPTHWIEIELLEEDDHPVAGERYWIQLTDGSSHYGYLDKNGRARYDGIDAGVCRVSFPDLDGIAWSGGDSVGPEDTPATSGAMPPRSWIGILLLGMDGAPVAGERYELRLPDGSVQKGVLDAYGTVYYGDLDPGMCELCFPDLPAEDWE